MPLDRESLRHFAKGAAIPWVIVSPLLFVPEARAVLLNPVVLVPMLVFSLMLGNAARKLFADNIPSSAPGPEYAKAERRREKRRGQHLAGEPPSEEEITEEALEDHETCQIQNSGGHT